MTCISSDGPPMDRDLRRPVAWGINWKKGSSGDMFWFLTSDRSMGEDFDRSR